MQPNFASRALLAATLALSACAARAHRAPHSDTAFLTRNVARADADSSTNATIYPTARRDDIIATMHSTEVHDPYRWLEDGSSAEVREWVAAQDHLSRAYLSALPQRPRFVEKLRGLMYATDVHPPTRRGNSYFYWKRDASQEKLVFAERDARGSERAILDPNILPTKGGETTSFNDTSVSPSGRYVAFRISVNNADGAVLRIRDLRAGRDLDEDIRGIRHNEIAWLPNDAGFYYRVAPVSMPMAEAAVEAQVKYHEIGTKVSEDIVVRDRAGSANLDESPIVSNDGRWLCIADDHGYTSTDILFRDLRKKTNEWQILAQGRDAIFEPIIYKGLFYLRTNEGASRYHIVVADPEHPQRENWRIVVPERADATLKAFRIVGHHLVVHWLKDAVSQLEIRDLQGNRPREVAFPDLGTFDEIRGEPGDPEVFVRFSSFTVAPSIFEIDVARGKIATFAGSPPSARDTQEFITEQTYFASKDGTRIPMFIVRKRDTARDGKRPTILYGYGGFEQSLVPTYRPSVLAWLREGGVYAAPNLRGGGEFGRDWHYAGMLEKKQNVFDDYIAAAQHLFREGWTTPQLLAARGQSNGGLLVSAAITQRPDLFRVALPRVPLTDMIRYPLSASGRTWVPEYGSPDIPEQFAALLKYSPYHHVEQGRAYPSILLLTADSDDRVDPMHSRKFVAAMQWASSGGPVLLSVQRNSGHMGADTVKTSIDDEADAYAFSFAAMGLP